MIKESKKLLLKADVLDLAVTVVIGAVFNAIATSLVENAITPLFLNPALKAAGVERIAELSWYGVAYDSFLSAVINFLTVGTTPFFIAKAANVVSAFGKKQGEMEEEAALTQKELLAETRDLLKEK